MKKLAFFFCFSFVLLASSCFTLGDYDWELDTYVGMTLAQVVELLGKPKYVDEYIIDDNYSSTPAERPLDSYFSKEELEMGIKITFLGWYKGKYEISVWLKNEDDELIVFASEKERRRRIRIPFVIYGSVQRSRTGAGHRFSLVSLGVTVHYR